MGLKEGPTRSWRFTISDLVLYCIASLKTSLAKYLVNIGEAIQIQTSVVKRYLSSDKSEHTEVHGVVLA